MLTLFVQMKDVTSMRDTENMQDIVTNMKRELTFKPEQSSGSTLVDFRRVPLRDISQELPVFRESKSIKSITLAMLLYLPLIFTSVSLVASNRSKPTS